MLIKRILKVLFVFVFLFLLAGGLSSCKTSRIETHTQKEARIRGSIADKRLLKEYDKKYKNQTKVQGKDQRKIIKKRRRNPKTMRPSKPFFLWRWFGFR